MQFMVKATTINSWFVFFEFCILHTVWPFRIKNCPLTLHRNHLFIGVSPTIHLPTAFHSATYYCLGLVSFGLVWFFFNLSDAKVYRFNPTVLHKGATIFSSPIPVMTTYCYILSVQVLQSSTELSNEMFPPGRQFKCLSFYIWAALHPMLQHVLLALFSVSV